MTDAGFSIGLVGPLPPPSGGMANQTRQLCELLRGEGIAVEVVQVNPPYRPAWIERLRGVRALFRLFPYLVRLWQSAGRVQLFHVMANSGWSWHLFAAPAIRIGALRGIPVVVNYRGGGADGFLATSGASVKASLARAAALVVPSGFLEQVFGRHGMGARVVPNIVNLERFRPRDRTEPSRNAPHLIVTRNLEPVYDIETALRCFARVRERLPGARMSVAGSGPERGRLEDLALQLGVAASVSFVGRLDNERMGELYRSADLMLNPSRVDNMPISVLEALASGVPVVSTDVGGVPFIVRDGHTALLVPPANPEAMARAVLRVVGEDGLAARLREAGLAEVQQYAWPQVRDRWLEVYRSALGEAEATKRRCEQMGRTS